MRLHSFSFPFLLVSPLFADMLLQHSIVVVCVLQHVSEHGLVDAKFGSRHRRCGRCRASKRRSGQRTVARPLWQTITMRMSCGTGLEEGEQGTDGEGAKISNGVNKQGNKGGFEVRTFGWPKQRQRAAVCPFPRRHPCRRFCRHRQRALHKHRAVSVCAK